MTPAYSGFLRTYCEATGYPQTLEVARELIAVVEPICAITKVDLGPYWKIPDYYGVTLQLEADALPDTFQVLISSLGTGWTDVQSEENLCSAVWNAARTTAFCHPTVRWANLEIFLTSSIVNGAEERRL